MTRKAKNQSSPCVPSAILCADWAKDPRRRAVYVVDVSNRVIRRLQASIWSLSVVLARAGRWVRHGSVLATFDVPLGVPESYLAAARHVQAWQSPANFLELLERVHTSPRFFDGTRVATDWSIERPFFSVPSGIDGFKSYERAADRQGVALRRDIDRKTGAKTLFAKSGIPGSVGSATCALWQELGPRLRGRSFRVWPFDGTLEGLLKSPSIVLGEIYPRAAYATALLDGTAESRPRLTLAKTDPDIRSDSLALLKDAAWVRQHHVTIEDIDAARASEDDFDACMTAAALLRTLLEGVPFHSVLSGQVLAEGGMLGIGTVNLQLPERTLDSVLRRRPVFDVPGRARHGVSAPIASARGKVLRCPIPDCGKEYRGSRGGWDAHVGSVRIHPNWHPELVSARDRKERFRAEFQEFFR